MSDSVIHHLGIGLIHPHQSIEYFERLLAGYLGMEREVTQEAVAGWRGRGTRIYLYPVASGTTPGALQHLAFSARSRGEVDAFPPFAVRAGITITRAPKSFPEYGPDYYATFFDGPENLRLELVHFVESAPPASARVLRWKAAWESRDADRVAALYAHNATHTSGMVPQIFPEAGGTTLVGVEQIHEYATRGLRRYEELRFDLVSVIETEDSSAVEYKRHSDVDGANPNHVLELIEWDGSRIRAVRVFHV